MTISNFKYSSPLFGVCKNADISGVVFDQSCSVERDQDFVSDRYLAPLAQKLINSQVRDCKSDASVGLKASATVDGCNIYMSGLVACSDATSSIKDCTVGGSISTAANKGSEKGSLYLGGLVAQSMGNIEACSSSVTIADSLTVASRYVGGLVGYVDNDLTIDFTGTSEIKSNIYVVPASNVYVGGVIGYSTAALTLQSPRMNGKITYDISADNVTAQAGISGIVGRSCGFLKVDDAIVSGTVTMKANSGKTCKGALAVGGVVAVASVGAEIKNSINKSEISWSAQTSNSNGHVSCIGGIAGRIDKGISSIISCSNEAYLNNRHYNNNGYSKGKIQGNRIGGIIGTYGYEANLDKETSKFVMSDCHNTFEVNSIRGFCGGLAGFLVNADVNNCSYKGNISKKYQNPYAAGIASGVENTKIENCDVIGDLYGQYGGSCYVRVGGVVAILYSSSVINNCRYFGNISIGTEGDTTRYGCMAGDTEVGCSISKCGIGGTLPGVEITNADFDKYLYGLGYPKGGPLTIPDDRPAIQVTESYYWNGK